MSDLDNLKHFTDQQLLNELLRRKETVLIYTRNVKETRLSLATDLVNKYTQDLKNAKD